MSTVSGDSVHVSPMSHGVPSPAAPQQVRVAVLRTPSLPRVTMSNGAAL